jgi:hypothetical protein
VVRGGVSLPRLRRAWCSASLSVGAGGGYGSGKNGEKTLAPVDAVDGFCVFPRPIMSGDTLLILEAGDGSFAPLLPLG